MKTEPAKFEGGFPVQTGNDFGERYSTGFVPPQIPPEVLSPYSGVENKVPGNKTQPVGTYSAHPGEGMKVISGNGKTVLPPTLPTPQDRMGESVLRHGMQRVICFREQVIPPDQFGHSCQISSSDSAIGTSSVPQVDLQTRAKVIATYLMVNHL